MGRQTRTVPGLAEAQPRGLSSASRDARGNPGYCSPRKHYAVVTYVMMHFMIRYAPDDAPNDALYDALCDAPYAINAMSLSSLGTVISINNRNVLEETRTFVPAALLSKSYKSPLLPHRSCLGRWHPSATNVPWPPIQK